MAIKTKRKRHQPIGDPNDPQGMVAMMEQFFEWMQVKNYSERTIEVRRAYLRYFIDWAAVRGISQPAEVTKPIIERYQRFMFHFRKREWRPAELPQPARAPGRRFGHGSSGWRATTTSSTIRPATSNLPRLGTPLAQARLVGQRSGAGHQSGQRHPAAGHPGPCHSGNLLLHGHPPHGNDWPASLRPGRGAGHDHRPAGQRQEGPHDSRLASGPLAWIERYLVEVRPGLLVGDKSGDTLFLNNLGEPFSPEPHDATRAGIRDGRRHRQAGQLPLVPAHDGNPDAGKRGRHPATFRPCSGTSSWKPRKSTPRSSIRKLKEIHTATHPARKDRLPSESGKPKPPSPSGPQDSQSASP